ncbi:TPA: hypothetical protein ACKPZE_005707, partial [Pseudomonas aeruginosa]
MPERYTLEHWEQCLPAMKRLHPDTLAIARAVFVDGVKPIEVARHTGRSAQMTERVDQALQQFRLGLITAQERQAQTDKAFAIYRAGVNAGRQFAL